MYMRPSPKHGNVCVQYVGFQMELQFKLKINTPIIKGPSRLRLAMNHRAGGCLRQQWCMKTKIKIIT